MTKKLFACFINALFIFTLSACALGNNGMNVVDAKMCKGLDEKLMPLAASDTFASPTPKVFCWFRWKATPVNSKITASWHYVTDNVHILDYSFAIPRPDGIGSVALFMPEGKNLPPGLYRVDLKAKKAILKSLAFKVLE